jgi:Spy/CpxP family protein refolding chaperone
MKAKFVVLLSLLFLFGFTSQSFSQGMGGMNPQERMKQQLQIYKERLKLTDAQFNKIDTILKDQMIEIQKLRDSSGGDMQSMRDVMIGLREKTNKKIQEASNTFEGSFT